MKILKEALLVILILTTLAATWQFDNVFFYVEDKVSNFLTQADLRQTKKQNVTLKTYKPSKLVIENGAFLNSSLELSDEEYSRYKYLQAFKVNNCFVEESCEEMNMHVLWRGDEFVFMHSRSVSDVDYYGPFNLERVELLEYLKANENLVVVNDVCVEEKVGKKDNFGKFGLYFRAQDCGLALESKQVKDGFWIAGLRIFLSENTKRRMEISKYLIQNGFTCVSYGEKDSIDLVEESELNLVDCSFFETLGDISLETLAEIYKFSSSFEKVELAL